MTDAHPHFPGITLGMIGQELRRELTLRRNVYPKWVQEGRMKDEERQWKIGVFAAMEADLAAMAERHHAPAPEYSWQDRLTEMENELAHRRRLYPKRIAEGRLDAADATRQRTALEALKRIYEDGWGWQASNGINPAWGHLDPTPEQSASRSEWRDISAMLQDRRAAQEDAAQPAFL